MTSDFRWWHILVGHAHLNAVVVCPLCRFNHARFETVIRLKMGRDVNVTKLPQLVARSMGRPIKSTGWSSSASKIMCTPTSKRKQPVNTTKSQGISGPITKPPVQLSALDQRILVLYNSKLRRHTMASLLQDDPSTPLASTTAAHSAEAHHAALAIQRLVRFVIPSVVCTRCKGCSWNHATEPSLLACTFARLLGLYDLRGAKLLVEDGLHRFPSHPMFPLLMSVILQVQCASVELAMLYLHKAKTLGLADAVELKQCEAKYFFAGLAWQPGNAVMCVVFAIYLQSIGLVKRAESYYKQALNANPLEYPLPAYLARKALCEHIVLNFKRFLCLFKLSPTLHVRLSHRTFTLPTTTGHGASVVVTIHVSRLNHFAASTPKEQALLNEARSTVRLSTEQAEKILNQLVLVPAVTAPGSHMIAVQLLPQLQRLREYQTSAMLHYEALVNIQRMYRGHVVRYRKVRVQLCDRIRDDQMYQLQQLLHRRKFLRDERARAAIQIQALRRG
ncbi:hypothetical protein DYB34_006520 [Aphanomyces astaci]|uniref:Uncharacterized protein n=1 Tax=Aphanomyces astaci TaxID=112090 RepID=A0A418BS45_APHAT|nr:hypothetical protein DYB34_006520 [Aphanomyces astaci]